MLVYKWKWEPKIMFSDAVIKDYVFKLFLFFSFFFFLFLGQVFKLFLFTYYNRCVYYNLYENKTHVLNFFFA